MSNPAYILNHTLDTVSEKDTSFIPKCNEITFENEGTTQVTLFISGSRKVLNTGETLSFAANHPEVIIMTRMEIDFVGVGTNRLNIYRGIISKP